MDRAKETSIPLPQDLYERLVELALQRDSSVDDLVREACLTQYPGAANQEERLAIVRELAGFSLPVGTPEEMKRKSAPAAFSF